MEIDPALQTLIAELGDHMGLDSLALDQAGFAALRFDDDLVVNLQAVVEEDTLMLYADLGPPASGTQLYPIMLQANLFWRTTMGATLSLSEDQPPHAVVAREVPWRPLDLTRLVAFIERFVNTSEDWAEMIRNEVEDEDPALSPTIGPADDLTMIRV